MKAPAKLFAPAALALAVGLSATLPLTAAAAEPGAVYVLTNQASANSVMTYDRAPNGTLTYSSTYLTDGAGAGTGADPLGSQGALLLHAGLLFAVNAGSNEISVFQVNGSHLTLVDKVSSGGTMPVSITARGSLVYVLNSGGTPNITGFVIGDDGRRLLPLENSTRPLAGGAASAGGEVLFSNDGRSLIVTEKGTQLIDSYRVDARGYAAGPMSITASAAVPFGFDVSRRDFMVVTEAASGSVSSYDVDAHGALHLVTGPIALGQKAACWLLVSEDGHYAFSANAGSGTISTLGIGPDGTLTLLEPAAASLVAPLDMAFGAQGEYLYARDANGGVTGFRVGPGGTLTYVTSATGVPAGAQGIAAQ